MPFIQGVAFRTVHGRGESVKTKRLSHAQVRLLSADGKTSVFTTTTDRRGAFAFHPEAGVYVVSMIHPKYYEVRTDPFLVPRQNLTLVEMKTASEGDIVIQR